MMAVILAISTVLAATLLGFFAFKKGFYWRKTAGDYRKRQTDYKFAKHHHSQAVHEFVALHCPHEMGLIQKLDAQIENLENTTSIFSPKMRDQLHEQKKLRETLLQQIKLQIKNQEDLHHAHVKLNLLKKDLNYARKTRNHQHKIFYLNAVACVGMMMLALACILIATDLVRNPIALIFLGLSLLVFVGVRGLIYYFFHCTKLHSGLPLRSNYM